jgi:hypothetical protein
MSKKKTPKLEIQPTLYHDFQAVFEDILGRPIPELRVETMLMSLGIDSLSFLEAVQTVGNKYNLTVTVEELGGALVFGRVVFVFENKVAAMYADRQDELQEILAKSPLK